MQKFISFIIKKIIGFYINLLSYIYPVKATKLAYKFFSEPRVGRLFKDKLPTILKEAEAGIITHKNAIYQTYTWPGNDKKVLLVHGWESNTARWELLLPYLRKSGSTVIAIDAPAHGLSSGNEFNIPKYAEVINAVAQQVKPNYLIGHSLGGATAIYYQSHYQTSIEKIVILGAPSDLKVIVTNYLAMLSLNSRVSALMDNHFIKNFKFKTEEFAGSLFASKIKIKGLLAHDKEDTIVSFKEAKKIADAWPGVEFVQTKGLGHSLHDDALYRKIYSFLFNEKFA